MRSLVFCGLALLQATAVRALVVPADLPAGLYPIPFDDSGAAIGDPVLVQRDTTDFSLEARQAALPQSTTKCSSRGSLNINDFQVAKANLLTECDRGVAYAANMAVIHTTGTAI